jgi:hypothetical protein
VDVASVLCERVGVEKWKRKSEVAAMNKQDKIFILESMAGSLIEWVVRNFKGLASLRADLIHQTPASQQLLQGNNPPHASALAPREIHT